MSIYGPKPTESTKNKYLDPIGDALGEVKCYSITARYQWDYYWNGKIKQAMFCLNKEDPCTRSNLRKEG